MDIKEMAQKIENIKISRVDNTITFVLCCVCMTFVMLSVWGDESLSKYNAILGLCVACLVFVKDVILKGLGISFSVMKVKYKK